MYASYYYPSYYYPATYYSTPSYYYGSEIVAAPSYYPVAGEMVAAPISTVRRTGEMVAAPMSTVQRTYQAPAGQPNVPPKPKASDGTFPYNGGPSAPRPMPETKPAPKAPPVDGKLVSLPNENTGGAPAPRVAFPAYGDEPIAPAPRKTIR
jgi:hypothetical protein